MDPKRLRSSLKTSADDFLSHAAKINPKSGKAVLKTLIHGISPSSDLPSALPPALHLRISQSLDIHRRTLDGGGGGIGDDSPLPSPPNKRPRRTSRKKNHGDAVDGGLHENAAQNSLKRLQAYALVAHFCVSHPKKVFAPSAMLPCVRCLHDGLILYESEPALMSVVASLCEEWWKEGLVGRESVVSQTFSFLLAKSLQSDKKVDLHRVFAIREVLTLFEFDDDNIEDLKHLLIRCVITSIYLKVEEGRRFVAYLFGLNRLLSKEIFAVMKAQISFGKKSILEGFGDILFRAWKGSEESLRVEFEDQFLQGLFEGAIYAKSGQLSGSIRRVLGGFVGQRTVDGVVKLIFRLLDPVLFRSLQVANANVRQNALHIFLDIFPLEDPDATKEAKDTLLEKQFFLLDKLLVDDCPPIRVVAVEGACRILGLFWEIIPSIKITKLLSEIVDDMAYDICHEVRLSVLKGVRYLIENPLTHEILKVLLPRLGHMFFDGVLSVRMAVADILLAVRDLRNFQFTKVVGFDALLSSLATDNTLVAKRITKLLIPSYLPSKVEPKEACSRCIVLIKRSPSAGARFCEHALSEGSSPGHLMELVRVCAKLSLSLNGINTNHVEGLLHAAATICESLATVTSSKTPLSEFFTKNKLKCLLTSVSSSSAQTSILRIASSVCPENLVHLLNQSIGVIMDCSGLSENAQKQEEVRIVYKVFLNCGKLNDLMKKLTHILQEVSSTWVLNGSSEVSGQNTRRKKAKVKTRTQSSLTTSSEKKSFHVDKNFSIAAGVAWQIKDLLTFIDFHKVVFDSSVLEIAFSCLKLISELTIEKYALGEFLDASPVLAYMNLALHMSIQERIHNLDNSVSLKEETTLGTALVHMFFCTNNLLIPAERSTVRRSKRQEIHQDVSNNTESEAHEVHEGRKIQHIVKLAAILLRFVADSTVIKLVSNYERCLEFTSAYFRFVTSKMEKSSECNSVFTELDLREMFICLKSSITYAARLLQIVLTSSTDTSPPSTLVSNLTNDLFDVIFCIESTLGMKHALNVVMAVKEWIPDMILALGSPYLLPRQGGQCFVVGNSSECSIPCWLAALAKAQVHDLDEEDETSNQGKTPPLGYLVDMAITCLKNGHKTILDAIGLLFLKTAEAGLQMENFELFMGLVHFACAKLVGSDYRTWDGLELMSTSIKDLQLIVDNIIQQSALMDEDNRFKLDKARSLLESVQIVQDQRGG